jgi:hypothetical protein
VLPGYAGIIVRDGYSGYAHLTDALHAWCGAHLLRDLKDLYDFEEGTQDWARDMAALLVEARDAARDARRAGETALDPQVLADLTGRYRELAAAGLAANLYRRTATAGDARRIARRFLSFEDMILRFATRPDLDIFTNNEAERTIRPVKACRLTCGVRAFDMARPPRDDLRVPTTELEGKGGGRGVQYGVARERSRAAGGRCQPGAGPAGRVPQGVVPVFNGAG